MSDYQPKVGDKVMVGEHGPYAVLPDHDGVGWTLVDGAVIIARNVPANWLTPAPKPEPDEPTAPGALVRDENDHLWVRDNDTWRTWHCMTDVTAGPEEWHGLNRPCVILADPAEVEDVRQQRDLWKSEYDRVAADRESAEAETDWMRAEVKGLREDVKHAEAHADELQRRIDKVLSHIAENAWIAAPSVSRILRGES